MEKAARPTAQIKKTGKSKSKGTLYGQAYEKARNKNKVKEVPAEKIQLPYGLRFTDLSQNALVNNLVKDNIAAATDEERGNIYDAANSIIDCYNKSVAAYQEKQQQKAVMWGAILGAAAGSVLNIVGGGNTSTTSTKTTSTVGPSVPAASGGTPVTSSSSSSSSSGSTSTPTRHTCRRCSGSGRCIRCKGSGKETTFSGKSLTICGACNGNGKCLSCNGQGYH